MHSMQQLEKMRIVVVRTCGQTGTMMGVCQASSRLLLSGLRSSSRLSSRSSCIMRSSAAPWLLFWPVCTQQTRAGIGKM
jgi:hypothetical protein